MGWYEGRRTDTTVRGEVGGKRDGTATIQTPHKWKTGRFSAVSCCSFQYCRDSPGLVSPATSCMLHEAGERGKGTSRCSRSVVRVGRAEGRRPGCYRWGSTRVTVRWAEGFIPMQWTASDARASPVTGMFGSACANYPPQSFLA
jgi:hypothetical protein